MSQQNPQITLRPAGFTYLVVGCVVGPLLLLYLYLALAKGGADVWIVTAILAATLLLGFFWVGRFLLSFQRGTIIFRSLFGGTRKIAISEIEQIRTEVGFSARRPIFSLVITTKTPSSKLFVINLRIFKLGQVRELMALLTAATGTKLDIRESLFGPVNRSK